jgi:hypothetical protein
MSLVAMGGELRKNENEKIKDRLQSIPLIVVLIIFSILIAQSLRNCEIPGSSQAALAQSIRMRQLPGLTIKKRGHRDFQCSGGLAPLNWAGPSGWTNSPSFRFRH